MKRDLHCVPRAVDSKQNWGVTGHVIAFQACFRYWSENFRFVVSVKSWVNLLIWLMIGPLLSLAANQGPGLLFDTTLDNDYNL